MISWIRLYLDHDNIFASLFIIHLAKWKITEIAQFIDTLLTKRLISRYINGSPKRLVILIFLCTTDGRWRRNLSEKSVICFNCMKIRFIKSRIRVGVLLFVSLFALVSTIVQIGCLNCVDMNTACICTFPACHVSHNRLLYHIWLIGVIHSFPWIV